MIRSLSHRSLPEAMAEELEKSIWSGTLRNHLPGRRVLAKRYSVSPRTVVSALSLLEIRGFLEPAEPGKRRKIILPKASKNKNQASKQLLILHQSLAPLTVVSTIMLHEIQTMWTEKFGMVHWAQVDFGRYQNPGHLLDKLIERHQADAVILLLPTDGWSGPALERRPVFQFGGLYQTTLPYSLCSYEINKEVKQAVHHLAQVGHRKILIPRNDQHTGDVLSQCLEETLSEFGEHGNMEKWCPVFPEKEASAWNRYWKKSLMELNPTAVIVADDIGLLSLYGFCSEAGIHIPRGLSVISLSYDERLSWMRPKPTMMRFPADKALTLFEEWLENDFRPIGKNFLNLQMIAGDSIAEPNH